MKLLFDTNIILDLLLERKPYSDHAELLFNHVESNQIIGYVGATTITTIYYLLNKALPVSEATIHLKKLLELFEVAPVNRLVLEEALLHEFNDFEDAVLHSAALHIGVDAIVTRNQKDFKKSQIPIFSPEELLIDLSLIV